MQFCFQRNDFYDPNLVPRNLSVLTSSSIWFIKNTKTAAKIMKFDAEHPNTCIKVCKNWKGPENV